MVWCRMSVGVVLNERWCGVEWVGVCRMRDGVDCMMVWCRLRDVWCRNERWCGVE